jgi:hypothetical protein
MHPGVNIESKLVTSSQNETDLAPVTAAAPTSVVPDAILQDTALTR